MSSSSEYRFATVLPSFHPSGMVSSLAIRVDLLPSVIQITPFCLGIFLDSTLITSECRLRNQEYCLFLDRAVFVVPLVIMFAAYSSRALPG